MLVAAPIAGATAWGQSAITGLAQTRATVAEVPKFRAEGSWPKLPSQWTMAIVSSTSIDDRDHLWVLQRPNTLSDEERPRAAPPVLEFDTDGNFIQGWGGPGASAYRAPGVHGKDHRRGLRPTRASKYGSTVR